MPYSLSEIAAALGARLEGRGDLPIRAAAEPADAGPEDLALAMDRSYAEGLARGRARAAILWDGADWRELGLEGALFVARPRLAIAGLSRAFDPGPSIAPGIHPSAVIDPAARIGEGAAIAPFVVIGPDARIGPRARIGAHCVIGAGARIGADATLAPGVIIGERVVIGERFIAQSGAVIGSDGYSYVTPEPSNVERVQAAMAAGRPGAGIDTTLPPQPWIKIHSLGAVEIGDDVEVGANATIDRGTIRNTRIGRGTKIDNLVHVGHNCEIGEDCLLCGLVGIAGSARLGNRVVMGGGSGVADHMTVADDVVAGGATSIMSSVRSGQVLLGTPATPVDTQFDLIKAQRRLPRALKQLSELRKTVAELVARTERDPER